MTCKATVSHFAKYPIANPCRQTFFAVSRSKRPAGASSHLEDRLLNLPEKRVAGFGKVSPSQWKQLVPLSHRGLTRVPFHPCSAMSSDEYEIMTRWDAPPNDAGGSLFQHAANTFGGSSFRGSTGARGERNSEEERLGVGRASGPLTSAYFRERIYYPC